MVRFLRLRLAQRYWASTSPAKAHTFRDYFERFAKCHESLRTRIERLPEDDADIAYLQKELKKYSEIAALWKKSQSVVNTIRETENIISNESDVAMQELAQLELQELSAQIIGIEKEASRLLFESEPEDKGDAILEIRAGTGGEEAALFAAELLSAYEKHAQLVGWNYELLQINSTDGVSTGAKSSGCREATALISGANAFGQLRYEGGVHRVQRVPRTDSQGRIHTSTVTVAILPRSEDVLVEIAEKDLRFDSFKSSGPGGQHVNKTNSAVRVTHLPTGISIAIQDERCAQQNRQKALRMLQARLNGMKKSAAVQERRSFRQSQIGSADRSEKIRTYNFSQSRITDHRIGISVQSMDNFFDGKSFSVFWDQLLLLERQQKLETLLRDTEMIKMP